MTNALSVVGIACSSILNKKLVHYVQLSCITNLNLPHSELLIIIIITKIYRAPKTINTLRRYLQQLECIVIICKII